MEYTAVQSHKPAARKSELSLLVITFNHWRLVSKALGRGLPRHVMREGKDAPTHRMMRFDARALTSTWPALEPDKHVRSAVGNAQ